MNIQVADPRVAAAPTDLCTASYGHATVSVEVGLRKYNPLTTCPTKKGARLVWVAFSTTKRGNTMVHANGTDDFDVIVIGAGYGGVTTAALCANQGNRVALIDKTPRAGGKTQTLDRKGERQGML